MKIEQPISDFFTAGGTLPPDAPSYVKRPTDDELFRHIMAGEFCYVLTPRQMGKSSLMIRTAQRLQGEGIKSAIVDLTVTGTVESEDQWYKGILTQIKRRLRLDIDPVNWWEQRKDIPNIQKFVEFFEEVLTEVKAHIVIFMDEIDTTLKLDFRDDFFAGIRAIFNARAENPDLKRLTFVLLGVASPSDLIKDRNRTPFNIGQEIPLRSFSRENARMLETGLGQAYPSFGRQILDRIFYWTNGHPYLTQKLCQSVVETGLKEYDEREIDLLVKNLFTSEEANRETNLQFVRDNILNYPERRVILSIYKKLLRGAEIRDNKNSLPQNHLKLSGLARAEDGKLVVSNKIYSRVFDQRWVNKYTEIDWRYPIIGVLSLIIIGFASVFYNDGVRLPNQEATRVNGILIYRDDRGIHYLADLFRMEPFIFANDYEYKANDTFFNGFSTWEDQKSLIEIKYGEPPPFPEDYKIVIAGLYTNLADVDNSGQTTRLLEVMQKSLKEMKLHNESLYREITHWLEARKRSKDDPQGALEAYSQALRLNPQNPATLFERARIYARQGEFELALRDYDQVIAIVPESNIEPTTQPTSEIPVNTSTLSTLLSTSVGTTRTPVLSAGITTASTITSNLPVATATSAILTATASVEATSALPLQPIQSRFLTLRQRVAAVDNEIRQNSNLSAFLANANSSDYSNLALKGLIPTVIPTSLVSVASTSTLQPESAGLSSVNGMVQVPANIYEVGKNPENANQSAVQSISLPAFWIDQYQVTNADFQQFVPEWTIPPGKENHPAIGVTWEEADAYCRALNKRLPSEAEWEAAARGPGPDPQLYPWGKDAAQALKLPNQTYEVGTQPFNVSPVGAFDMWGNVFEWVGDPYGKLTAGKRILRGVRYSLPYDLAFRREVSPNDTQVMQYTGFRCAADQANRNVTSPIATSPIATLTLEPGVLYHDNFTNPSSGWPVADFTNYLIGYHESGNYHIEIDSPDYRVTVFKLGEQAYGDITIEMEVSTTSHLTASSGDFRYGLVLRRLGDQFYVFAISPSTKKWYMLKSTPSGLLVLKEGRDEDIHDRGADVNDTLRVDAQGSTFYFSINDRLVGQVTDPDYATGEVGLYSETFDSIQTHIAFDTLTIRDVELVLTCSVSAGTLYVRSGPGTTYSQIAVLSGGDTVQALGISSNQWIKIAVEGSDEPGWVSYFDGFMTCIPSVDFFPIVSP